MTEGYKMKTAWLLAFCLPVLAFSQIMRIHQSDGSTHDYSIAEIDSITFASHYGALTWIGHASVKIKTNDGIVIYIDPYAGNDYKEAADIILVSHGHSDHNQVNKVTQKANCRIFSGPSASVGGTKMTPGDSVEVDGISIKAVDAYNSNHPKGSGVGFIIAFAGVKIYHSGDTGKIDEMAALTALNLNYAMLCIDGVYNMNAQDAAAVAQTLPTAKAIPIHIAPSNASAAEKQRNIDKFNPPNKLILKEGET
ncbi:MAG: hypothetical protein EHM72_20550, partial [Calditrichaeota bacterium]